MQTSSLEESRHKFNKILIQYRHQKELKTHKEPRHSEKSHLLKYFPKYYSHLILRVGHENSLFSKIKRIKKLGKLTINFEKKISEGFCRTFLGNHRKNMKEIPQINCKNPQITLRRLTLWKIKSFPNITRLFFPRRKVDDSDNFLMIQKSFMRYLRNMRRLRNLEIILKDADSFWMEEKLNGMQKLLCRLEVLGMEICDRSVKIQEILKHKDLMTQLTSLKFSFGMMEFDPSLKIIPEICKNLKSFGISFESYSESDRTQFENFMNCMKELPELGSLRVDSSLLPFDFFRPTSSTHISKYKWNLPQQLPKWWIRTHWTGIDSNLLKELDEIEFNITCRNFDDLVHYRRFMSMVMKEARKLRSFKFSIQENFYKISEEFNSTDLTFVTDSFYRRRLYESLERFEYSNQSRNFSQFDLKELKEWKNLKILKLEVHDMDGESIEELVNLLQKNQKEGDYSLLQLKLRPKGGSKWFEDIIRRIRCAKYNEGNLKIVLDFRFPKWFELLDDFFTWETFADVIIDCRIIKGLFAHFWLNLFSDDFELLEIFDGRVKVLEGDRNNVLYQNPNLYII